MDADLAQIPGFANLRDTGGYRVGATSVRHGALLRADAPSALTEPTAAALRGLDLVSVLDLRDQREIREAPSGFDGHGFTVTHLPIFDGSAHSLVQANAGLTDLYLHMVEGCATTLTDAVRAVATAPTDGAVLVHCTAGKDRTGITVALALRAVGVARADVVANYVLTESRLRGPWLDAQLARIASFLGAERAQEFADLLVGSPAEAIEAVLDAVEDGPERTRPYLRAHGMTDEELAALERRLLG